MRKLYLFGLFWKTLLFQAKCEQYWPDEKGKIKIGDFIIKNNKTDTFANYTIRELEVSYGNEMFTVNINIADIKFRFIY